MSSSSVTLLDLPTDILGLITHELSFRDFLHLDRVSKACRQRFGSNTLWRILYRRDITEGRSATDYRSAYRTALRLMLFPPVNYQDDFWVLINLNNCRLSPTLRVVIQSGYEKVLARYNLAELDSWYQELVGHYVGAHGPYDLIKIVVQKCGLDCLSHIIHGAADENRCDILREIADHYPNYDDIFAGFCWTDYRVAKKMLPYVHLDFLQNELACVAPSTETPSTLPFITELIVEARGRPPSKDYCYISSELIESHIQMRREIKCTF